MSIPRKPPPKRAENVYRVIFPNGEDKKMTTNQILALPKCTATSAGCLFSRLSRLPKLTQDENELAKLRYYSMSNVAGNSLKYKIILANIRGIRHSAKRYRRKGENFQEIDGVIINTMAFGNPPPSILNGMLNEQEHAKVTSKGYGKSFR